MSLGGTGQSSNSNNYRRACAACKHQRKKCNWDKCVLAPYFPVSKPEEFQAIHKVFGVKNLAKMLCKLDARQRDTAVKSYIWEALLWMRDPVNGPRGHYRRLEREFKSLKDSHKLLLQNQQRSSPFMPGLGVTGVTPEANCVVTNNKDDDVQNSYASHVQEGEIKCQGVTRSISPHSTNIVQGQERVSRGRAVPIAHDQLMTLAQPAEREGQRNILLDGGRTNSSVNIASIDHPVEQEELRTNSYNTAVHYHHGRDQTGINIVTSSSSFWQGQERVNQGGGGHIEPTYATLSERYSESYYSPYIWNNLASTNVFNTFASQQQQQHYRMNTFQSYNIQDQKNQQGLDDGGGCNTV